MGPSASESFGKLVRMLVNSILVAVRAPVKVLVLNALGVQVNLTKPRQKQPAIGEVELGGWWPGLSERIESSHALSVASCKAVQPEPNAICLEGSQISPWQDSMPSSRRYDHDA